MTGVRQFQAPVSTAKAGEPGGQFNGEAVGKHPVGAQIGGQGPAGWQGLPLRVVMNGNRLDIQASVNLAGLKKLKDMLTKYESILEMMVEDSGKGLDTDK